MGVMKWILLLLIAPAVLGMAVRLVLDIGRNGRLAAVNPPKPRERGNIDQVLYDLIRGRDYDRSQIDPVCAYMEGRYDCADFLTPSLLRVLYDFGDSLDQADYDKLKRALTGFKYWMTDPGDDSMCYWSENHQILFSTAEYLAGALFPEEVFSNTGMTGAEHADRGRERVLTWLAQRWAFGFTEWYSNTYYKEDIGPLAVLIDLAPHGEVRLKASIIMDLLFYDMASQSFRGSFVTTMGRGYETKRMSGRESSLKAETEHFFGFDAGTGEERSAGMGLNLIYSRHYELPPVLKEIARDESPQTIKASQGLNLDELEKRGLIGLEDRQIMMQWAMESFSNPPTVGNTLDYADRHGMLTNGFLNPLKDFNISIIRQLGLLGAVSRLIGHRADGAAIQRADTYTYRTRDYMIYTAQAYHPGTYGDQHHLTGVTLADDLSVFHSHPAVEAGEKGVLGNSPTYWVGYGRLPHTAQHENVNLAIYRLPDLLGYTHAYFPSERFDESSIEGRCAFGRRGDAYVALITPGKLAYRYHEETHKTGGDEYDLILPGREVYWITECSSADEGETYDAFRERIRGQAEGIGFDGKRLSYLSRGRAMTLEFGGAFRLDGEEQDLEYGRYDSAYVQAEREPDSLRFEWNGRGLYLDFDGLERRLY